MTDPLTRRRLLRLGEGVRSSVERTVLSLAVGGGGTDLTGTALREAVAHLSRFLEVEQIDTVAVGHLEAAIGSLRQAEERSGAGSPQAARIGRHVRWVGRAFELAIAQIPLHAPAIVPTDPPEMMASLGVPRAHWVEVSPPRLLTREVEGETEEEEVDDEEVDNAEVDDEESPPKEFGGSAEVQQCRAIGRDCLEDIGSMGSLRKLYDEEVWVSAEPFEERLLANLDAAVALARPLDPTAASFGLMNEAYTYATEWDVPDLGRAFALAFTGCCLASETALRWVVLALRRAHLRVYPAFVDALSLGSNLAIDRTLTELLGDDNSAVVTVALRAALRRKGAEVSAAFMLLAHPEPEVVCGAIALVSRAPSAIAIPLLAPLLDEPDTVGAAAATALVGFGDSRGAPYLRALLVAVGRDLTPPQALAFETLCLLGDSVDVPLLGRVSGDSETYLPWLGWHGFAEAVPALTRALIQAANGIRFESAQRLRAALERILGVGAPDPHGGASFEAELVTWVTEREKERPTLPHRLRFGRKWAPDELFREVSAPTTPQGARRALSREIGRVSRSRIHLDVEGWVAAQRRDIKQGRQDFEALS